MGRKKLETSQLLKSKQSLTKIFKQRKDVIMKKAFELSTLCDVQVGVIIFGPNADSPDIWPNNSETLINILNKYQITSVKERRKRTVNLSNFGKKDSNAQEGYEVKPENSMWNHKFDSLSVEQLLDMVSSLDSKIEVVKSKINLLKNNQQFITSPESDELPSSSPSYSVGVQQGVLMNDSILPGFQCDDYHPVIDDQYSVSQFLEEQRYADLMMMLNDDGFCDFSNDVDMGDYCSGLFMEWNNLDGVMFNDSSPTTWWRDCNPGCLMPEQALQFDAGGELLLQPLNYNPIKSLIS